MVPSNTSYLQGVPYCSQIAANFRKIILKRIILSCCDVARRHVARQIIEEEVAIRLIQNCHRVFSVIADIEFPILFSQAVPSTTEKSSRCGMGQTVAAVVKKQCLDIRGIAHFLAKVKGCGKIQVCSTGVASHTHADGIDTVLMSIFMKMLCYCSNFMDSQGELSSGDRR